MSEEDKSMVIVKTPAEVAKEVGFQYDDRFKFWAKKINGIDLTKEWGYALEGEFIDWNKAVVFENNVWLVLAGELGSRKDHSPTYMLSRNQNGKFQQVKSNRDEFKDKVPPDVYAKARNSTLYAFAVRIDYTMKLEGKSLEQKVTEKTVNAKNMKIEEKFAKLKEGEKFRIILSDGVSSIDGYKYEIDDMYVTIRHSDGKRIAMLFEDYIREVI